MKFWKVLYIIFTIIILISGCANENGRTVISTGEDSSTASFDSQADTSDEELSSQWEQEQLSDKSLYEYTAELEEIPELGYCSYSMLNTGQNYICYKDILILSSTIYKKGAEKYMKQELTLHEIFNIDKENKLLAVDARQYKNLIIAVSEDNTSFLIYDMDTHTRYCCYTVKENMEIGPFWCVYDGCIYFSEWDWDNPNQKEETLKKIDLLNNNTEKIYRLENGKEYYSFGFFGIRKDGAIMYEIYNDKESCREYWIAKKNEDGEWSGKKIWETNEWKFSHLIDFNQFGLIVMGEGTPFDEFVAIKENGEMVKLDNNLTNGRYLFTDKGCFCSNLAELEHMPWENDGIESEWLSRYLADSVSFYDYEGNRLNTYSMVSTELLEKGYYLDKLTYSNGKLTGFYVQRDTEELYISQIDIDL